MEEPRPPQPPEQPEGAPVHPQPADHGLAHPPALRGDQQPAGHPGRVDTWATPPPHWQDQQWHHQQWQQQSHGHAVPPPPQDPSRPQEPPKPTPWQRIRARGWRLAIGVGIAGAALLLIPFFLWPTLDPDRPVAQWWPPFAIGLGTLILLSVLRLDRLLRGWTWHVAGVVFVGALVVWTSANPWAWAFALSVGVLLVGLLRLPRPELAVVGAVLCAVSLVGFSVRAGQITQQQAQIEAHAGDEVRATVGGVPNAQEVGPLLDRAISGPVPDPEPVCRIVSPAAAAQLAAATGTADCTAAVTAIQQRRAASGGGPAPVTDVPHDAVPMTSQQSYTVGTCTSAWAAAAGPQLGRVTVTWTNPTARRYAITAFVPC